MEEDNGAPGARRRGSAGGGAAEPDREPCGLCPVFSLCPPALFAPSGRRAAPLSREEVLKTAGTVPDRASVTPGPDGAGRASRSVVQVCLPEGTIGSVPECSRTGSRAWFMTSGTCFWIRFSGGSGNFLNLVLIQFNVL